MEYKFECKYANGIRMVGSSSGQRGAKLIGDKGWIFIKIHGGQLEASDESILKEKIGPDEIHIARSPGHQQNLIESMQSRKQPVAEAEIGHRSCTACLLSHIAMKLPQKLYWDPKKEQFINNDQANKMLSRPQRRPDGTTYIDL